MSEAKQTLEDAYKAWDAILIAQITVMLFVGGGWIAAMVYYSVLLRAVAANRIRLFTALLLIPRDTLMQLSRASTKLNEDVRLRNVKPPSQSSDSVESSYMFSLLQYSDLMRGTVCLPRVIDSGRR